MSEAGAGETSRILAAGLSPAWQQIMVFDRFRAGEVNRASEVHWCASGKVLNVGIALAQLAKVHTSCGDSTTDSRSRARQASCRTLSVIGRRARVAIEPEFGELGVDCRWVETAAETRICTTILDRGAAVTTELVENAAPLTIGDVARFRQVFAEETAGAKVVVLTGSLPNMQAPCGSFYRELIESVGGNGDKHGAGTLPTPYFVLDIRGPEMLSALECKPWCVKPNREELAATLGRDLAADDDLHAAMRELNDRGAQWVVITHGAEAVWASHQGRLYRFLPPRLEKVVNPIGSGDCLAAGIAWAFSAGRDMPEAIRLGIAAAVDNVGQCLPARLDTERILALERRVEVL